MCVCVRMLPGVSIVHTVLGDCVMSGSDCHVVVDLREREAQVYSRKRTL